jgi:hypothetical protein
MGVSACVRGLWVTEGANLPLGGEIAVSGEHTARECVVFAEDLGRDEWELVRFGRGVHLCEDIFRERLADSDAAGVGKVNLIGLRAKRETNYFSTCFLHQNKRRI